MILLAYTKSFNFKKIFMSDNPNELLSLIYQIRIITKIEMVKNPIFRIFLILKTRRKKQICCYVH